MVKQMARIKGARENVERSRGRYKTRARVKQNYGKNKRRKSKCRKIKGKV